MLRPNEQKQLDSAYDEGILEILKEKYLNYLSEAKEKLLGLNKRGVEVGYIRIVLKQIFKELRLINKQFSDFSFQTSELLLDMITDANVGIRELINQIPDDLHDQEQEFIALVYNNISIITNRSYRGDLFRRYAAANLLISILSEDMEVNNLNFDLTVKNHQDVNSLQSKFTVLNGISLAYQGACETIPIIETRRYNDWVKIAIDTSNKISSEIIGKADLKLIIPFYAKEGLPVYTLIKSWVKFFYERFRLAALYFSRSGDKGLSNLSEKLDPPEFNGYQNIATFLFDINSNIVKLWQFFQNAKATNLISKNEDTESDSSFLEIMVCAETIKTFGNFVYFFAQDFHRIKEENFFLHSVGSNAAVSKNIDELEGIMNKYETLVFDTEDILKHQFSQAYKITYLCYLINCSTLSIREKDSYKLDKYLAFRTFLLKEKVKIVNPVFWFSIWQIRLYTLLEIEKINLKKVHSLFKELQKIMIYLEDYNRLYFTARLALFIYQYMRGNKGVTLENEFNILEKLMIGRGFTYLIKRFKEYKIYVLKNLSGEESYFTNDQYVSIFDPQTFILPKTERLSLKLNANYPKFISFNRSCDRLEPSADKQ